MLIYTSNIARNWPHIMSFKIFFKYLKIYLGIKFIPNASPGTSVYFTCTSKLAHSSIIVAL